MLAAIVAGRVIWPESLVQYIGSIAAPLLATFAMAVWLLGFSRLALRERLVASLFFLTMLAAAALVADHSLIPFGLVIFVLPAMLTLPVLWLRWTGGAFAGWRRRGAYLAVALPLLVAATVRVDGISGSFAIDLSPRWSDSPEETYLATLERRQRGADSSPADRVVLRDGDWPGFRGARRDGVARGAVVPLDWPGEGLPEQWRRRIGPGWSSFAIVDGRLFTQEQRGEEEAVLCLDAETGAEIWAYTYAARFYEMASNAGPRATPTFDAGRLYSLGATGILTALDAASGERLWQTDIAADSGAAIPEWGFSASPLVVDGRTVIVLAGDPGDKVLAYDAADGSHKWSALSGGLSYSSPHLMTLAGIRQVIVNDSEGTFGLEPHSGEVLWRDPWEVKLRARIVQPLQIDGNSLAIGTGYGIGTRRIRLEPSGETWTVEEQWLSRNLKPYFNDFVYHRGYLYGFDHQIVTCIDAATGQRQWKKGRYGFGQMLLIPEQDLLLVSGERGQLALLRATPDADAAKEIARFDALDGKTWNHPVIVGDRLYLRNAEEAVCYSLRL